MGVSWGARRKRLGYQVQMDTAVAGMIGLPHARRLDRLHEYGDLLLHDPSFVLLRIENNGARHIDTSDYTASAADQTGIRIHFPGRRIADVAVTEFSDDVVRVPFELGAGFDFGLNVRDGAIELPKVPLHRSAHYKVFAVLDRLPGDDRQVPSAPSDAVVVSGGVRDGEIQAIRGRRGTPRSPRAERRRAAWLAAAAALAYVAAFFAARPVLTEIRADQLGPGDAPDVITAIGALGTAIGLSTAAIIKAVASLIHAKADMVRARAGLEAAQPAAEPEPAAEQE
ncbi:phosphate-binding protein [Streptomyces sp. A7024]|uniref:Phosphate-binding protein n=1 Tax=Streptomyces coryli TaxID=1128680 RepID=A0A6G4U0K6_9ACTN|nr:phosphate-binding protein [Streptomyces coryli]NGN65613.1 phosphate-binding protein [Streptomyces coryli]